MRYEDRPASLLSGEHVLSQGNIRGTFKVARDKHNGMWIGKYWGLPLMKMLSLTSLIYFCYVLLILAKLLIVYKVSPVHCFYTYI